MQSCLHAASVIPLRSALNTARNSRLLYGAPETEESGRGPTVAAASSPEPHGVPLGDNASMFVIREAKWLAPAVRWLVVEAPRVAARHKPGQFVIVRVAEGGERIPLTIADSDAGRGTITLIIQAVGATHAAAVRPRGRAGHPAMWPARWASPPRSRTSATRCSSAAAWARP